MVAVGASAWLLPASLAVAGCTAMGWVQIDLETDLAGLEVVAYGVAPFALGLPLVARLLRGRTGSP